MIFADFAEHGYKKAINNVAGEIEKALLAAGYEKRDTIERVINPFKSPVNEKMANDVIPDTTKETGAVAV